MGNSSSSADNGENEQAITQEDLDEKNSYISELLQQIEELEEELEEMEENNDTSELEEKIEELTAELDAKKAKIEELTKNTADVSELNEKIKTLTDEVAAKKKEITGLNDSLNTTKTNYDKANADLKKAKDDLKKANDTVAARDKTIGTLNNDITTYKSCEGANDKLIIALRRYQSAPGFVKLLFDNKDWLMYIVNDFDKNWRTHKWYKYLWNIAFTFKNTTRVIVIFGAKDNGFSPVRSPANFKSINKGFIAALEVDPQLTAYNMVAVITNPLLASKYKISFWGGHRQKPGDDASYTYQKTLGHDQTGTERHKNLNQTAWMWNWMNTVAYDPKKYPNMKALPENVTAFTNAKRIVGTVNVTNNNRDVTKANVTKVEGWYTKRPTAAG